jgi:hypothetical protein
MQYHEYYKNIKEGAIEYNKSITQLMPVNIDIIFDGSWDTLKSLKIKLSDTVATVKQKMIDDRKHFPKIIGPNDVRSVPLVSFVFLMAMKSKMTALYLTALRISLPTTPNKNILLVTGMVSIHRGDNKHYTYWKLDIDQY